MSTKAIPPRAELIDQLLTTHRGYVAACERQASHWTEPRGRRAHGIRTAKMRLIVELLEAAQATEAPA